MRRLFDSFILAGVCLIVGLNPPALAQQPPAWRTQLETLGPDAAQVVSDLREQAMTQQQALLQSLGDVQQLRSERRVSRQRFEELEAQIALQRQQLEHVYQSLEAVTGPEGDLADIVGVLNAQSATIAQIQGDITSLEGRVEEVEWRVGRLEERTIGVGFGGEAVGFFDGDDFSGILGDFGLLIPIGQEDVRLEIASLIGGDLHNLLWGARFALTDEVSDGGNRLGGFAAGYFLEADDERNNALLGLEFDVPIGEDVEAQLHGGLGYEFEHHAGGGMVSAGFSWRPF